MRNKILVRKDITEEVIDYKTQYCITFVYSRKTIFGKNKVQSVKDDLTFENLKDAKNYIKIATGPSESSFSGCSKIHTIFDDRLMDIGLYTLVLENEHINDLREQQGVHCHFCKKFSILVAKIECTSLVYGVIWKYTKPDFDISGLIQAIEDCSSSTKIIDSVNVISSALLTNYLRNCGVAMEISPNNKQLVIFKSDNTVLGIFNNRGLSSHHLVGNPPYADCLKCGDRWLVPFTNSKEIQDSLDSIFNKFNITMPFSLLEYLELF